MTEKRAARAASWQGEATILRNERTIGGERGIFCFLLHQRHPIAVRKTHQAWCELLRLFLNREGVLLEKCAGILQSCNGAEQVMQEVSDLRAPDMKDKKDDWASMYVRLKFRALVPFW